MTSKMILSIFSIFLTIQQLHAQCQEFTDHRNYHLLDLGSACGHGFLNKVDSRITSGINAGLGVHPWVVHVDIMKDQAEGTVVNMTCAGTLINNRYVLTAAQCYHFDGGKARTKLYLGMYRQSKFFGGACEFGRCSPPVKVVEVADTILHPSFDSVKLHNDIALLRLEKPVEYTDFIKPICLPLSCNIRNTDYSGTLMTVAGWGYTSPLPAGREADALQSLEVPVVANQRCADSWGDTEQISDSLICAGGRVVGSACAKDSGGPLMTQNIHNGGLQYFQIGIVSQGQCASTSVRNKPGIYTKVGYFMLWILDNIRE